MKKMKLLTSLSACLLLLGLGACDEITQDETPDEGGETTETGDTSESTETGETSESTETGETGDTGTTEGGEVSTEGAYAIVGDFVGSSWNESPATDSIYYIPAGTEEYKVTVTIDDQGEKDYDAGFSVVEYGTWNRVIAFEQLEEGSTGVGDAAGKDNNIVVTWGATYDLTITLGDTPSILVTIQDDEGDDDGDEDQTFLFGFETGGTKYYADGGTATGYAYEGTYTTNVDNAVRVTLESTETAGEYYLSYVLNGTTYWITIIESNSHINLSYATTAAPLYWNDTYNCWGDNTLSYFLCQNSTYSCLYCSAIASYISSSPIARLYTEAGEEYTSGLVGYELPAPTNIVVSGNESLYIGNTTQLRVTVEPTNANPEVTWSTSSGAIATVSDTGLVEGIGTGTVTITATSVKDNNVSGSINIAVSEKPAGLEEVKLGTYDFTQKTAAWDSAHGTTYALSASNVKATFDEYWSGDYTNPLSSIDNTDYIYQYFTSGGLSQNRNNHRLLKTGSGSYNGIIDMTTTRTITKVEFDQQSWSTSENCTITVNNSSQESASKGVQQTLTFDITGGTTSLQMTFAKRCYIYSITLYGYAS